MHRVASVITFILLLALHFDVWWRAPRPAHDVLAIALGAVGRPPPRAGG